MAQKTTGIRSVLSLPFVYKFFQNLMSKGDSRRTIMDDHIRAKSGDRVLDVGCGPADMLPYMPQDSRYIGVDLSEEYIKEAKEKFGDKGIFINKDVNEIDFSELGSPDIILLMGVMHHLNDNELTKLFSGLTKISHPKTRLITLDGCYRDGQNPIARKIISMDRGQNVRDIEGYLSVVKTSYSNVTYKIREDISRFPYTYIIFECSNDS